MAGVDKDADSFHVIIELRQCQGLDHGRDTSQRPIFIRLGKVDIDGKFDFPVWWRGIDQDLCRLDGPIPQACDACSANDSEIVAETH